MYGKLLECISTAFYITKGTYGLPSLKNSLALSLLLHNTFTSDSSHVPLDFPLFPNRGMHGSFRGCGFPIEVLTPEWWFLRFLGILSLFFFCWGSPGILSYQIDQLLRNTDPCNLNPSLVPLPTALRSLANHRLLHVRRQSVVANL